MYIDLSAGVSGLWDCKTNCVELGSVHVSLELCKRTQTLWVNDCMCFTFIRFNTLISTLKIVYQLSLGEHKR